jgi:hypothetical protein
MSGVVQPLPALTRAYKSTGQTITSGGSLVLAHGLGVKPSLFQVSLICQTAEHNYSIGDELFVSSSEQPEAAAGVDYGYVVTASPTQIVVRFGNAATVFQTLNKAGGTRVNLTNANWNFVVRAWA